jgi:hypothetical protein
MRARRVAVISEAVVIIVAGCSAGEVQFLCTKTAKTPPEPFTRIKDSDLDAFRVQIPSTC